MIDPRVFWSSLFGSAIGTGVSLIAIGAFVWFKL